MNRASATAKLNLALVVGPVRDDGKHEVTTVLQRLALADRVRVEHAPALEVDGFPDDTLVRAALEAIADAAGVPPRWRARIAKRVPVAAGLGGGSSDAASAIRLANALLDEPLPPERLHELAKGLGADVPFFLATGPQLGQGDGSDLTPLELPQDYVVLLVLPQGSAKPGTASVYRAFDARNGADGYELRRESLVAALAGVHRARDLAALPANDLATSPLADELRDLGAFRSDVSGAGPTVYALFHHRGQAEAAERAVRSRGRTWITAPAWYG